LEMDTLVRLGESLYAVGAADLATHKETGTGPRTNAKLQEAAHILSQVTQRFPDSDYVVEALFLTGKIRREEKKFDEARDLFNRVINNYPDSDFVPQALFQLVLMSYDQQDIDGMTDSATRLVYGYPKNPLVAEAFLRVAEYYYTHKDYGTAASIYKRALDRFPDDPKADLVAYRMATAYYREALVLQGNNDDLQPAAKPAFDQAMNAYLDFNTKYPDNELADDSLYWAAFITLKEGNALQAYQLLTKQILGYPGGDMKASALQLRAQIATDHPEVTDTGQ